MIEIKTDEFLSKFTNKNKHIINNTGRPAIIDLWAPWCGSCRVIAPILDKVSTICTEVDFYKLDADAESAIAELLKIREIPTILGLSANFNNETGLPVIVGVHTEEQIKEFIHDKVKNCK
jgi:thioredoxin